MKKPMIVVFLFFLCGCLQPAPTFDLKTANGDIWASFSDRVDSPYAVYYKTFTLNRKHIKNIKVEESWDRIVLHLGLGEYAGGESEPEPEKSKKSFWFNCSPNPPLSPVSLADGEEDK